MFVQQKNCSACGTVRHFDYFPIDPVSRDGHSSVCVACAQPEMWARVQQLKSETLAVQELQTALVKGIVNAGDRMKSYLNFATKEEKYEPWFHAQCEYMYLLLHLVDRIAGNKLGSDKRRLIHERLVPSLINTFIQTLCDFLSEGEQKELCADSCDRFVDADAEYGRCLDLIAKQDPFNRNYVFSILASRLTCLSNNENDSQKFVEIQVMSFATYQELNLEDLVLELGSVIREYATNSEVSHL